MPDLLLVDGPAGPRLRQDVGGGEPPRVLDRLVLGLDQLREVVRPRLAARLLALPGLVATPLRVRRLRKHGLAGVHRCRHVSSCARWSVPTREFPRHVNAVRNCDAQEAIGSSSVPGANPRLLVRSNQVGSPSAPCPSRRRRRSIEALTGHLLRERTCHGPIGTLHASLSSPSGPPAKVGTAGPRPDTRGAAVDALAAQCQTVVSTVIGPLCTERHAGIRRLDVVRPTPRVQPLRRHSPPVHLRRCIRPLRLPSFSLVGPEARHRSGPCREAQS
ncbi:hypothetical protein SAMN05660485_00721 [Blastococcus fimeti]|nr:hypothetical protein SAMN05660485_00721 [Blastococcus fimeti]